MKIDSTDKLREIYGEPKGRSVIKVLPYLEKHSRNFIRQSPFVVISTSDSRGNLDSSPRGGDPGFVHILDRETLLIPDSKGNKRLDSMANIVETGQIGTLFLLPGVNETLRINGAAEIVDDPSLLSLFNEQKNPPATCIRIAIGEMYLHCAKALMRSKLWSTEQQIQRSRFPTIGQMIKDQTNSSEPPESQEAMVERYQNDL